MTKKKRPTFEAQTESKILALQYTDSSLQRLNDLSIERILRLEEQMKELHGLLDYEKSWVTDYLPSIKIGWRRIGLQKVAEHFKRVFV